MISLLLTGDICCATSMQDHGYQLGERNIWCKETNFNLATHVPLFIRAAGMTSGGGGGRKVSAIVELVDVRKWHIL